MAALAGAAVVLTLAVMLLPTYARVRSALARAQGERLVYLARATALGIPGDALALRSAARGSSIRRARVDERDVPRRRQRAARDRARRRATRRAASISPPTPIASRLPRRAAGRRPIGSPRASPLAAPPPPGSTTSVSTARSARQRPSLSGQHVVGALVVTGRADGLIAEARSAVLDLVDLLRHRLRARGRAGLLQRRALHARRHAPLAPGGPRRTRRAAARARLRVRRRGRRARRLLPQDDVGPSRAHRRARRVGRRRRQHRRASSRPARSR